MKSVLFSIIIPVRTENDYLRQTLSFLKRQTLTNFEIIIVTDKISGSANPAYKRNLGAKMANGKYLAFIDDDSYPDSNWLQMAAKLFNTHNDIAAVCGPCLTPTEDNFFQQASGLVHSSLLGSGGAGTYRNSIGKSRYVDDYPSVNLIVQKTAFMKIKGFDTFHWPGEDTILCLNLTHVLKQKILYHSDLIVYHHRRSILLPHLQQIGRYALHRGHFAKIFPQTSFRLGYLLPSLFCLYLLTLIFYHPPFYLLPLFLYLLLIILTFINMIYKSNNIILSLVSALAIIPTHLTYGYIFIIGFFKSSLKFSPHQVDSKGNYLGG